MPNSPPTATDCDFTRLDGSHVKLSEFAGRPLLLIFLRHLACIACRAHLAEVQSRRGDFESLGAQILVVSFTPAKRAAAYLEKYPLPFDVVTDPELTAYRAFRLGRTRWTTFFRPDVLARYTRAFFGGTRSGKLDTSADLLQLGGDFVLDARQRILLAHPCREPTDRPSADALLAAVASAT